MFYINYIDTEIKILYYINYTDRDKNPVLCKDLLNLNFSKTNMVLIIALGILRGDPIIYLLIFICASVSDILGRKDLCKSTNGEQ